MMMELFQSVKHIQDIVIDLMRLSLLGVTLIFIVLFDLLHSMIRHGQAAMYFTRVGSESEVFQTFLRQGYQRGLDMKEFRIKD